MHSRGDSEKRHHVPSVPEIMCSLTCTLPVLNDQSSSKIVTVYNAKRSIDHCIRCQCPPNFSPGDRTGARTTTTHEDPIEVQAGLSGPPWSPRL